MRAAELAAQARITHRQLAYWVTRGYVLPPDWQDGTLRWTEFDDHEARVVNLMGRLVNIGVTPAAAAVWARHIAKTGKVKRGGFVVCEATVLFPPDTAPDNPEASEAAT